MSIIRDTSSKIFLHAVSLNKHIIHIPVAEIIFKTPGKTIVVTAGADGDEYASIEAAYELIDILPKKSLQGRIIIIPILNIPGFYNLTSYNPMDRKYPKYIFPGDKKGSPTEMLMSWLWSNYVSAADVWIDLHSGAIDEVLEPFVGFYKTSDNAVNSMLKKITRNLSAKTIIFEEKSPLPKDKFLSAKGIPYIITESGQSGERNKKNISFHIDWVEEILKITNSDMKKIKTRPKTVFKKICVYKASKNGLWYPLFAKTVKKREIIGQLKTIDKKVIQTVSAKNAGILLWAKQSLSCKKGDILAAFAFDKAFV